MNNSITVEINPSIEGAAEIIGLNKNDGNGIVLSLYGGGFSPEDLKTFLETNPTLKVGLRMGEGLRLTSVLKNGVPLTENGEGKYLSVNKGDRVLVLRDYESAIEISSRFPEEKVIVLDTRRAKDPKDPSYEVYIPEIVFGHNDCHLELTDKQGGKRYGDTYVVNWTVSGKIFDHEEVMAPTSIIKERVVLTPKDKDLLKIMAQHRGQVKGIEVSNLSTSYDVSDLYDALKEIFCDDIPEIIWRIENLACNASLDDALIKFKSLGISPKIVIGYERLRVNEKEDAGGFYGGTSPAELEFNLYTEVRRIIDILKEAGIKEVSIDWGLVFGSEITAKIKETVSLEIGSGIKLHYWISRPTIGMSKGAEVVSYLEGTRELRREVIKGLLTELTGTVVGSNI